MAFRTKLDFSSNRQVKQHIETTTVLSGATNFGVPFGDLPTGPNLLTSGETNNYTFVMSTFSGNSAVTIYNWYDPRMALGDASLSAITPSNSATTQTVNPIFTANTLTTIDGNTVALDYSGISFDITAIAMVGLGGGNYSGTVETNALLIYSAGTLDFTGRTIWADVSGITRTDRLIVGNNPTVGYVLTCVDSEGMVAFLPSSGGTSGTSVWITSSGTGSAVLNGSTSVASGNFSVAEGQANLASGFQSHAEGIQTSATTFQAHSEGAATLASGTYSHAEGNGTVASGSSSHAEGEGSQAFGDYSHAEGYGTSATTSSAHAEGANTLASAPNSHAEGTNTISSGGNSHAQGYYTIASGGDSHAEGTSTRASGPAAHAEGYTTSATSYYSHAEGSATLASGPSSHAEGNNTQATNDNSHAEGYFTIAAGFSSHAEGGRTSGATSYAHAEGLWTLASGPGIANHAEGTYTIASGNYAHAEGQYTLASGESSHAQGWSTSATSDASHAEGIQTRASGLYSHAEGSQSKAIGDISHAEGYFTSATTQAAHSEGLFTIASGLNAHAEGESTRASGPSSHAEGNGSIASGDYSHAEGQGSIASGGRAPHAEGYLTVASGSTGHAEGVGSIAGGNAAHAEGSYTLAQGSSSHAQGYNTQAYGDYSHASGYQTLASGSTSFVHGSGSTANGVSVIVLGSGISGGTSNTTYVDYLNVKRVLSTAFANDIRIDANGNLTTNTSDERLKENITPLTGALDKVKALQGVTYQWKDRNAGTDAVRLGFIAQQVESVEPLLVFTNNDEDGYKGLHIDGVIPLLVEAIKELTSGSTTNQSLETQTILAEDNNIDLNYNGTPETAVEGGIRVLHAKGIDSAAELVTDTEGNWITNNDFKPNSLTIPQYTPTSSSDAAGTLGNVARDEDYIYIKTSTGWKRANLESF